MPLFPPPEASARRTVLNVGCGLMPDPRLEAAFPAPAWREVRLDIDPAVIPDIVASITDMAPVASASVDAVWSSHSLEHLYPREVPRALAEFLRVLKPGGVVVAAVPDLQAVAALIAADHTDAVLYASDAGPVGPLDVVYGYGPALAAGKSSMAHRTGFTPRRLGEALQGAGFEPVFVRRVAVAYELRVEAYRPPVPAEPPAGVAP